MDAEFLSVHSRTVQLRSWTQGRLFSKYRQRRTPSRQRPKHGSSSRASPHIALVLRDNVSAVTTICAQSIRHHWAIENRPTAASARSQSHLLQSRRLRAPAILCGQYSTVQRRRIHPELHQSNQRLTTTVQTVHCSTVRAVASQELSTGSPLEALANPSHRTIKVPELVQVVPRRSLAVAE